MSRLWPSLLLLFAAVCTQLLVAQEKTKESPKKLAVDFKGQKTADTHTQLAVTKAVQMVSADSSSLYSPKCDSDGNLYFMKDLDPQSGIQKINSKGETTAVFRASSAPDLQADLALHFWVALNGDVYQLVQAHPVGTEKPADYVFIYDKDGNYKSRIKPDKGHIWQGNHIAVFPSGDILIAGQKYDTDRSATKIPSTIIFSSDGTPLKEVEMDGDDELRNLATSDPHVVSSIRGDNSNRAVSGGSIAIGQDGNAYLMRNLPDPVIYAISPGGEVVRQFTVKSGGSDYMPFGGLIIAGDRIAIYFHDDKAKTAMIKVVDLEGHDIATYDKPKFDGKMRVGVMACYSRNPETLTFFGYEKGKTFLAIAEPK
jgi:hypothetical protein